MKTSELQGLALDWAVAKSYGMEFTYEEHPEHELVDWHPSIDWSIAGPIIELQNIMLKRRVNADSTLAATVEAECYRKGQDGWDRGRGEGETMLIAAMRCYVDLVMGDEIEVPF
jgi:hypothetical protein